MAIASLREAPSILRNHGLLTVGVNATKAFNLMYRLEKSAQS